jgi:prepilin-type N-terminal cleavage/methylation domain-containing protein
LKREHRCRTKPPRTKAFTLVELLAAAVVAAVLAAFLLLETNTQAGWTRELHNCQGNILLVDGSVQQVASSGLRRLLSASGATNRLAMP